MTGIEISGLSFTYPNEKYPVLNNINLNIQSSSWTAIIGHNGSGKSTLARLMDGLLLPDQGKIVVNGIELNEQTIGQIHQEIGFVFQNPENQFVGATVADDVAFGLENRNLSHSEMDQRIKQVLTQVGMLDYAGKEPGDLSGGQKQRVALASVLALQPRIIILDEATSMLDPVGRHEILKLLQKLRQTNQMTIISITHDPDEIELTDETIVVDQSQIKVQGPSQKVLHQASLLQEIGVGLTTGERLRQLLAKRGVDIPDRYFTLKEIEQWIVQQLQ